MRDFLTTFVVALFAIMATAFVIMLNLGSWHSITPGVPALGFADCVNAVALSTALGAVIVRVARF